MEKNSAEFISTMYREVAQDMRFLSEWRFKSIQRYILTLSALLAMSGWLIMGEHEAAFWDQLHFVPYLLITIITIAFIILETRNATLQNLIIKTGYDIETKYTEVSGIFEGMKQIYSKKSYTFLLKWFYVAISTISFIIAVLLFIKHDAWCLFMDCPAL
ncbi:MAG: hypothetical protein ABFS05_00350 [Bacteroidota bacterium]